MWGLAPPLSLRAQPWDWGGCSGKVWACLPDKGQPDAEWQKGPMLKVDLCGTMSHQLVLETDQRAEGAWGSPVNKAEIHSHGDSQETEERVLGSISPEG